MNSIKDSLEKSLKKSEWYPKYIGYKIRTFWKDIVGDVKAQYSCVDKMENGILYVIVTNTTWMQQLHIQKRILRNQINTYCNLEVVRDVRFKIGPMRKYGTIHIEKEYELTKIFPFDTVTIRKSALDSIEKKLEYLSNETLKMNMRMLFVDILKRKYFLDIHRIHTCPSCGITLFEGEKYCRLCTWKIYRKHILHIQNILKAHPTLIYMESDSYINCSRYDFYRAKEELIQKYIDKIRIKEPLYQDRHMLALLTKGKKAESMDIESVIEYTNRFRMFIDEVEEG